MIYSSIPLDFYSDGAGGPLTQAEAESYAANVIDYGHDVAFDMV